MFGWFLFGTTFIGLLTEAKYEMVPSDCGKKWSDCDCRNRTHFDNVEVLSWHIHYTTNSTDMKRFYWAFLREFRDLFDPRKPLDSCPFGPNWGLPWNYVCSLEEPDTLETQKEIYGGTPWGDNPQRAFFIPIEHIDLTWAWAQENRGYSDVLRHPNTGCMHGDHSDYDEGGRGTWVVGETSIDHPLIYTLEFPCNIPKTGCNDTIYSGPPSCGCDTLLDSEAPWDSCANCQLKY